MTSNHHIIWCVILITGALFVYLELRTWQNNHVKNHSKNQLDRCLDIKGENMVEVNILCFWLKNNNLLDQANKLQAFGVQSLDDVVKMKDEEIKELFGSDMKRWTMVKHTLPRDAWELSDLKRQLSKSSAINSNERVFSLGRWVKQLIILVVIVWGLYRVADILGWSQDVNLISSGRRSFSKFFELFNERKGLARNARVCFHWKEPMVVGNTVTFSIQFFGPYWSGQPYPVSDADDIRVNIRQGTNKIAAALQLGSASSDEINVVKATFTVRRAGEYHIEINLGPIPINGSPFLKHFLPGQPDGSKTSLVHPVSTVVCTAGVPHQLLLEPRDEFGNFCSWVNDQEGQQKALDAFSLEINSVGTSESIKPLIQWLWVEVMHRLMISVTLQDDGIYDACLKLNQEAINKGEFNMLVLSKSDNILVEKSLETKSVTYETKLLTINGEKWLKNKKVFCTLSPKQIALKEYILGIIPKRLATFRLCPATKVTFSKNSNEPEQITLAIEDGAFFKVELISKEAHLLAASFALYLLKSIGGSDTFVDKQRFFYNEIRNFHRKKSHEKLHLRIERNLILEASYKLTKSFSVSDWCKNFEIEFIGEQGLDWGGLRREWIELLCVVMFDRRKSGMFTSFSDDRQALVHPNPKMPPTCKLKYYEFAGKVVGKCMYESSLGATYRQLIKARFTRSFLSQLIGLRISYKYFEHDDPQLYLTKVKYIEEHDINDMELFFVEDEYDEQGKLLRSVELISGGARIPVNNENKHRYLDALAHHRLVTSVKEQTDAFIRGLTEIIPDNLLSIFDENELELLVCGQSEYTVSELKAHHVLVGSSPEFQKVLSWFWTAVTNFGPEEMSRLLQFTTGSSQLPPGGLAELSPKLQISASPSFGILPTAHTCFNQLCLPDYDNYEQFEKALLIAINEGSEGFGFV